MIITFVFLVERLDLANVPDVYHPFWPLVSAAQGTYINMSHNKLITILRNYNLKTEPLLYVKYAMTVRLFTHSNKIPSFEESIYCQFIAVTK